MIQFQTPDRPIVAQRVDVVVIAGQAWPGWIGDRGNDVGRDLAPQRLRNDVAYKRDAWIREWIVDDLRRGKFAKVSLLHFEGRHRAEGLAGADRALIERVR